MCMFRDRLTGSLRRRFLRTFGTTTTWRKVIISSSSMLSLKMKTSSLYDCLRLIPFNCVLWFSRSIYAKEISLTRISGNFGLGFVLIIAYKFSVIVLSSFRTKFIILCRETFESCRSSDIYKNKADPTVFQEDCWCRVFVVIELTVYEFLGCSYPLF